MTLTFPLSSFFAEVLGESLDNEQKRISFPVFRSFQSRSSRTFRVTMAFVDYMTRVMITLVALVYPGYQSYKAVKRAEVISQQAWLKYWLVLSVLSGLLLIVEPFAIDRVPIWPLWKIVAAVVLVYPKTKGYEKIYEMVLQPQLDRHEATIDTTADRIFKAGQDQVNNVRPQFDRFVQQSRDIMKKNLNKKAT